MYTMHTDHHVYNSDGIIKLHSDFWFEFIIVSEANFLVCSMARNFYLFQAVRRAVNVLNVTTCI